MVNGLFNMVAKNIFGLDFFFLLGRERLDYHVPQPSLTTLSCSLGGGWKLISPERSRECEGFEE